MTTSSGSVSVENSVSSHEPKLSYKPLPKEMPLFEALFRAADSTENGSVVTHDEALEVLSLSRLPQEKLKMILNMTSKEDKLYLLNKSQFYTAVRLVQFTQNQQSVHNLSLTVPSNVNMDPPFFEGVTDAEQKSQEEDSYISSKGLNEYKTNEEPNTNKLNCEELSLRCFMMEKEMQKLRQTLEITLHEVEMLTEEVSTLKRHSEMTRQATLGMFQKSNSFPRISSEYFQRTENRVQSIDSRSNRKIPKTLPYKELSSSIRHMNRENGSYYGEQKRDDLRKTVSFLVDNNQRQRSIASSSTAKGDDPMYTLSQERYANSRLRSDLLKSFDYHQQADDHLHDKKNEKNRFLNFFWTRSESYRQKKEINNTFKDSMVIISNYEEDEGRKEQAPGFLSRSLSLPIIRILKRRSPSEISKNLRENIPPFHKEMRGNSEVKRDGMYTRDMSQSLSNVHKNTSAIDSPKFERYVYY